MYPVWLLCRCLQVSREAYYGWLRRKAMPKVPDDSIKAAVKQMFDFHKGRYGVKRISAALKETGIKAGCYVVRRVMRESGLKAKYPRSFRPRTTDSRGVKASPNLLKDTDNTALTAGEVLVGDITYLPLTNGRFCYLAMFQDKVTKRLAGWSVDTNMRAGLVTEALGMALRRDFVKRDAIIHTDRGSQYGSREFRERLERCGLRQSMSAKGNCYDNAQAESFFSRFKTEVGMKLFSSVEEVRSIAFDYIDCYYNRIRLHSTIGTTIPKLEQRLKEAQN